MRQVKPIVKTYDWGMPVGTSCALSFIKDDNDDDSIFYDKVAELWWGHPSVIVRETKENIEIPYLLKLLFVSKPLSLQVHPTSLQVQQFSFTDPSPKPEIVIALTDFEALCGFLSTEKILQNIEKIPPLSPYMSFRSLFSVPDADTLIQSVHEYALKSREEHASCRIFLSLLELYPSGDPAVLCPFYMNHVCLSKGQALVIPASQPHCYLSGQGVECMPPSDNVVRSGLTSKPCDIPLFFTITENSPQDPIIKEYPYNHPELDPFFLLSLPDKTTTATGSCVGVQGSVILVLDGEGTINGTPTQKGDSWIIDEMMMTISPSGVDIIMAVPNHDNLQ